MYGAQEQRSEVARLLTQISAEYEAAQRGLSGWHMELASMPLSRKKWKIWVATTRNYKTLSARCLPLR